MLQHCTYVNRYQGEPRQQLELVSPVLVYTFPDSVVRSEKDLAWPAVPFLCKRDMANALVVRISLQITYKHYST
jgi:hypothetical protein